jgi:hypothetical protein
MQRAVDAGFRAMKMEMLFYDLIDDRELLRSSTNAAASRAMAAIS